MSVTISNLPYGDRRPDLFIDAMVKSAAVLNRFRLIDGVKAKGISYLEIIGGIDLLKLEMISRLSELSENDS